MSINKLPKYAATRFAELCEAADEAQSRLMTTQRRIKAIEDQRRLVGDGDKETWDAFSAEIARMTQSRDRQRVEFEQRSRLVAAIRTWLAGLPASVAFETVTGPTRVAFASGEATDAAIDRLRREIEELQKVRRNVVQAIPPVADAHRLASARVNELAQRGRPAVTFDRGKLTIRFPVESSFSGGAARDALAITAWLHTEEMRARLHAEVDAVYAAAAKADTLVLAPEERDRRLAMLDDEILRLERQEEQCIADAEGYNMHVPRRENANPLAILAMRVVKRERSVA